LRAERARIARELHDLVTHSVTVMVMQTGAARQIMTKDERRSRAVLESVEATGRSALEELRRLLGLLSDQDDDAPLSPQPGVAEIPSLVQQVRQAGLGGRAERGGTASDGVGWGRGRGLPDRAGSPHQRAQARRGRGHQGRPALDGRRP
jgi:hypothetical protein